MAELYNEAKHFVRRRESIPRNWNELDSTQQEALEQLLVMIDQYREDAKQSIKPFRAEFPLRMNYVSNILFLDGDRGTGKSTVLYSLINAITQNPEEFLEKRPGSGHTESNISEEQRQRKQEIYAILQGLIDQNVIFLDPLDPELMPAPSNIIAALMVRIEEAFKRSSHQQKNFAYEEVIFPGRSENTWSEFSQLMRSVSIGWTPNLRGRQGTDPDTYAEEVLKTERARLKIKKFDAIISQLTHEMGKAHSTPPPLFILPVDDADLSPLHFLDLFHMIRRISSPHILFLVAGNYENLEKVFELKYAADFSEMNNPHSHGQIYRNAEQQGYISSLSHNLAHAALQKLIPGGSHLIHLKYITTQEGLTFFINAKGEREHNDKQSIQGLLKKIEGHIPKSKIQSLLFLGTKNLKQKNTNNHVPLSQYSQMTVLFSGTIRFVYDFWLDLSLLEKKLQNKHFSLEEKKRFLLDMAQKGLGNVLDKETPLKHISVKHFLDPILNPRRPELYLESSIHQEIGSQINQSSHERTFLLRSVNSFKLHCHYKDATEDYFLTESQTAWLLFYESLNQNLFGQTSFSLHMYSATQGWMQSTYTSSPELLLNWPALPWRTFNDLEFFKVYWKIFLDSFSMKQSVSSQENLDTCACVWTQGLLSICWEEKSLTTILLNSGRSATKKLIDNIMHYLVESCSINNPSPYHFDLIKSLIVIYSPERGVSTHLSNQIVQSIFTLLEHSIEENILPLTRPDLTEFFNEIATQRALEIIGFDPRKESKFAYFENTHKRIESFLLSFCESLNQDKVFSEVLNNAQKLLNAINGSITSDFNLKIIQPLILASQSISRSEESLNNQLSQMTVDIHSLSQRLKTSKIKKNNSYLVFLDLVSFIQRYSSIIEVLTSNQEAILSNIKKESKDMKLLNRLETMSLILKDLNSINTISQIEANHIYETKRFEGIFIGTDYPLNFCSVLLLATGLIRPSEEEYKVTYNLTEQRVRALQSVLQSK